MGPPGKIRERETVLIVLLVVMVVVAVLVETVGWMHSSSFSRNETFRHIAVVIAVLVVAVVVKRWKENSNFFK